MKGSLTMIVGEQNGHPIALEATLDRSHIIEETNPIGADIVELANWFELSDEKRRHVPTPKLKIESLLAIRDAQYQALHGERLTAWEKMNNHTSAMEPTVAAYTDLRAYEHIDDTPVRQFPLTTEAIARVIVRRVMDERDQDDYYVVGNLPVVTSTAPTHR